MTRGDMSKRQEVGAAELGGIEGESPMAWVVRVKLTEGLA